MGMLDKIQEVIEGKVKPYLKNHHGDIEVVSVIDGVVRVRLLGNCSGCPSARITVEEIVETALKHEIGEIKRVILEDAVSADMLDLARRILNSNARKGGAIGLEDLI